MNDVTVDFTYYDVYYVCDDIYDFLMALLTICGGMGLHMYIAQVNLKEVTSGVLMI